MRLKIELEFDGSGTPLPSYAANRADSRPEYVEAQASHMIEEVVADLQVVGRMMKDGDSAEIRDISGRSIGRWEVTR